MWKKKDWIRMRTLEMCNLRGMLGVRRMDKMRDERIWEICVYEDRIMGGMRWYSDVMIGNDKIFICECLGAGSVGRLRKSPERSER